MPMNIELLRKVFERSRWAGIPEHRPDLGPCLLWSGAATSGYGRIWADGKVAYVHRVAYESIVGPIPPQSDLDHLCRNPSCVNTYHLEPVTHQVNVLRGISPCADFARRSACHRGHEYTPENTRMRADGSRTCRTCSREACRSRYYRRRERQKAVAS